MFKSDSYKLLDKIICVLANDKLRMQRVMSRDNMSEIEVLSRMDKQMDQSVLKDRCDFVVNNDETSLLTVQLLSIHDSLLNDI